MRVERGDRAARRWRRGAGTIGAALLLTVASAQGAGNGREDEARVSNPFSGQEQIVPQGRTLFNVHCSHCHGPNAFQGERPRDLRRLRIRYRDDMPSVFLRTVLNGRPARGMPSWRGVVPREELWKIFTFLETVQK